MPIKAITFDCAQTLIEVAWTPELSLAQAAHSIGIKPPEGAELVYGQLYRERFAEFLRVNLQKSAVEGKKFYEALSRDWLTEIGCDPARSHELTEAAERLIFGPESPVFKIYADTLETLKTLRSRNLILGVVSNWDYSLHRVLEMFGLNRFFSAAVASLEEGIEKPDPRLFEIALSKLGARPEETLHIGDDPLDDVEGARRSGLRASLIDRSQASNLPSRISSLLQVSEAIACFD